MSGGCCVYILGTTTVIPVPWPTLQYSTRRTYGHTQAIEEYGFQLAWRLLKAQRLQRSTWLYWQWNFKWLPFYESAQWSSEIMQLWCWKVEWQKTPKHVKDPYSSSYDHSIQIIIATLQILVLMQLHSWCVSQEVELESLPLDKYFDTYIAIRLGIFFACNLVGLKNTGRRLICHLGFII